MAQFVEFLNEQMDPAEVLAVEIKHFVGTGLKTLVPRIIGQTAAAESRKGTTSGKRKGPRSEDELQQIANELGVGESYADLVGQMKPLFESMSTTRSNVAFYGKIEGVKSGAVIVALSATESELERGVAFGIYVDRLAEFFDLEKQQVIDTLPKCHKIEETGDWAGDIHRGFAKVAFDLEPLISRMKQAKQYE